MDKATIQKREDAWDAYSQQPIEFTLSSAFNAGYDAALMNNPAETKRQIVEEAFQKGRASVVFEPHSAYRDMLREMICEGDFDYTKIFEEIEYEGETYADISNEGADALADYFIGLMECIDERRSEQAEENRHKAMTAVLDGIGKEKTDER